MIFAGMCTSCCLVNRLNAAAKLGPAAARSLGRRAGRVLAAERHAHLRAREDEAARTLEEPAVPVDGVDELVDGVARVLRASGAVVGARGGVQASSWAIRGNQWKSVAIR